MKIIHISIVLLTIAILLRCANVAVPGGEGNGSETIARGVVVDSTGAAAAGVPVQLLPAAYDPVVKDSLPAEWHALTDAKGKYRLGHIAAGTYALEAGFASAGMKARVKDIKITAGNIEVAVDTGRMQKTGTVIVGLAGMTPHGGDYVYLPGTSAFTVIDAPDSVAGQAVLNDVPTGTFTKLIYVSVNDSHNTDLITDSIAVHPGDTVVSAYAAWKYVKQLFLNTTVSGADIANNVYNFPLLVRLNDTTFDFSQAQSSGKDIRFTKPNGSPLVHEIERWDATARKAELWVKVDTVYGNSSSQRIAMYWGNPGAADRSDGAAVFDTADGFQGVWHLDDRAEDSVRDATPNRYHGVSPDTARPSIAEGAIGNCRVFNGKKTYITMPNTAAGKLDFPQSGKYSVSAWVSADTFIGQQQTLVSKGRYEYFLWIDSTSWKFWEYHDQAGWETSAQKATLRQWVLLTAVRDGARQYLYVNGLSVDTIRLIPDTAPRNTGTDLTVGRGHELETTIKEYQSLCYFKGKIDEIRISSVSSGSDWIKLSYMNQRTGDKLIVFK
jgi:hypothetical protein